MDEASLAPIRQDSDRADRRAAIADAAIDILDGSGLADAGFFLREINAAMQA